MLDQSVRPRLAVVLGDPSGMGPELVVRALSEDKLWEKVDLTLVGGRREQDAASAMRRALALGRLLATPSAIAS